MHLRPNSRYHVSMRTIAAALACLLLPLFTYADVKIIGPASVPSHKLVRLSADGADPKAGLVWRVYPRLEDRATTPKGQLQFVAPPGTYEVELLAIKLDSKGETLIEEARHVVVVGEPGPGPKPPGPDPKPPDPSPTPAPIPEAGFRVLVVLESADASKLPAAQLNALSAKATIDYLNTKTVKGPDGKTGEWRIWDQNVDLSGERPLWQGAMTRALSDFIKSKGAALPWLLISDGKTGYSGPLPASTTELLQLLKKYGGE